MVELNGVKIYTAAEVVELVGICDRVIKAEIEKGNLKATKRAGRFWISETALFEYLTADQKRTAKRSKKAKAADPADDQTEEEGGASEPDEQEEGGDE